MLPIGPTKYGKRLAQSRKCGKCGVEHECVPTSSPFTSGLYWWDCNCGSTLTATEDMVLASNSTPPAPVVKSPGFFGITQKVSLPAVVKDKLNISHILFLPSWTEGHPVIAVSLNGKPTKIQFLKKSSKATYFKEV